MWQKIDERLKLDHKWDCPEEVYKEYKRYLLPK